MVKKVMVELTPQYLVEKSFIDAAMYVSVNRRQEFLRVCLLSGFEIINSQRAKVERKIDFENNDKSCGQSFVIRLFEEVPDEALFLEEYDKYVRSRKKDFVRNCLIAGFENMTKSEEVKDQVENVSLKKSLGAEVKDQIGTSVNVQSAPVLKGKDTKLMHILDA